MAFTVSVVPRVLGVKLERPEMAVKLAAGERGDMVFRRWCSPKV